MQELTTFLSNHLLLGTMIVILFILLVIVEWFRAKRKRFNVSPAQLTQLINRENAAVIDIRPNHIFLKGHIIDAESILASELKENTKKLEKFKNRPVVIVDGNGLESPKLANFLLTQTERVYTLNGGMRAWIDASMPIVKEAG